jgi:dsDNA-binding SOS-regulon protein
MKQVKSFETKDGKLFTDRLEAEGHELMLNIREFLQTQGRGGYLSDTDVAYVLAQKQDDLYNILVKYRKTMAGIKSNQNR